MRVKAYKHHFGFYTEIGGNVVSYHWEVAGILWWRKEKWVKRKTDELWLSMRFHGESSGDLVTGYKLVPGPKEKHGFDVDELQHEERDSNISVRVTASPRPGVGLPKLWATMKADGVSVTGRMRLGEQLLGPATVSVGYVYSPP
jgi:hypothetical protein